MSFKKLIGKIHLWLGLTSGLLVFIIAVTGCIYAFEEEIQDMTQPYRFVESRSQNFLFPSRIRQIADRQLPGKHIHAVLYKGKERAAEAVYYSGKENYYYTVYINPYSGEVLQVKNMNSGFFHFILDGHFYLWLPDEIGQPVVASATLIFILMTLTGLFLWWKRKKSSPWSVVQIKWNARWRRKNYDLHNVLGFYVMAIALLFALTGLVWGFEWFAKGYYAAVSGGKKMIPYYDPASDTTAASTHSGLPAIDKVWLIMAEKYPHAEAIEVHIPATKSSSIAANANPDASAYWKIDYRYFDQYTLKELPVTHLWGRLDKASAADILMKMNYDIHTGAVLGLSGKTLAFLASLVVASLPVTGFLIWWGRKNKKSKKQDTFFDKEIK